MSETRSAYLQETKRHGSVLFPFNIYPCTIPRDFPSVALHWHKSMELVYVKKGAGQVQAGMRWMDAAAQWDAGTSLKPAAAAGAVMQGSSRTHSIRQLTARCSRFFMVVLTPFCRSSAVTVRISLPLYQNLPPSSNELRRSSEKTLRFHAFLL